MLLDTTAAGWNKFEFMEANKIVCSMMWSSSREKKEVQRENSRYIIKTHMTKYGTILFQSSYRHSAGGIQTGAFWSSTSLKAV